MFNQIPGSKNAFMSTWLTFYFKLLTLAFVLFLMSLGSACIANQCTGIQNGFSGIELPHWPDLVLTFLIFSIGTMSPGPSSLMILATALMQGRAHAVAFSCGVVIGQFMWAILVATSLLILVTNSETLFSFMRFTIACYLIYMAFKSFRSCFQNRSVLDNQRPEIGSLLFTMLKGLAITLANGQVAMTWLATYAISTDVSSGAIFFAIICIMGTILAFLIYGSYALLFSTAKFSRAYKTMHRPFDFVIGVLFPAASVRLLSL